MSALDDCFLHDRDRLRHDEALTLLRDGLTAVVGTETLPLDETLGRVLAEDLEAPFDLPGHTNAAVDGYAFRHDDAARGPLPVGQRIAAGALPGPLTQGSAARIFTGAVLPDGADTVAMQEDCERRGDSVAVPDLRRGANVRQRGEDLRHGAPALRSGRRLVPADIATAAAFGAETLVVRRRLRVALFSSGDELRTSGTLSQGAVFDANRPMLRAWMRSLPVEIADGGILPDEPDAVERALREASTRADLIVTTGGASRGEEDHMLAALDALGERKAWQIAVKPGRPLMFGRIGEAAYLGLPGNPVAACVCFLLYARPTILALSGAVWEEPAGFALPTGFAATSKPDRREFLRASLRDGRLEKFARDGSGLISSLRESDGLIEVPEDTMRIAPGDLLTFLPWSSFR